MSLAHLPTAGKAGRVGASIAPHEAPRNSHQFFKATRSLVFNTDLTSTEKLLIMAIGLYDWGDGRGGHPGNRQLIQACGLKDDGKDGGQRCIRALLAGLVERQYIRVERVPADPSNRTGRILHLLPRAFGLVVAPEWPADPDLHVRMTDVSPGLTGPHPPDLHVRVEEDLQVREIDPGFLDPGTDPSSSGPDDEDGSASHDAEETEEAGVAERLAAQARKTFKDKARVGRVIDAISGLIAWLIGKTPDPERMISAAIAVAVKSRPGGEVGFIKRCLENEINNPKPKPPSSPPPGAPSKPVGGVIASLQAEANATEASNAMLESRWCELAEHEREEIERNMASTVAPNIRRWKPLFHAHCLDEMDRRHRGDGVPASLPAT